MSYNISSKNCDITQELLEVNCQFSYLFHRLKYLFYNNILLIVNNKYYIIISMLFIKKLKCDKYTYFLYNLSYNIFSVHDGISESSNVVKPCRCHND